MYQKMKVVCLVSSVLVFGAWSGYAQEQNAIDKIEIKEALALYPDNAQALALKQKIQRYYAPPLAKAPFDKQQAKELQKQTAEYLGVPVQKTVDLGNGVKMDFVLIPAGEFMMGSRDSAAEVARKGKGEARKGKGEEKWYTDEHPQHKVRISRPFYMSKFEVTQAQYRAIMGSNPSHFKGNEKELPVEQVGWNDATEFCRKLSQKEGRTYRLPTEAQWEYACRAGTTTPFYFGETISTDQANYNGNCVYGTGRKGVYRHKTIAVGGFEANAFGLHDMHGNLCEWCSDWYDRDYYSKSGDLTVDPENTQKASWRVLRGGSWYFLPGSCRSATRDRAPPDNRGSLHGFRVVVLELWEDDRIGIILDKLERTDAYPAEFIKTPGYRYSPPKEGHDFVVIYFTITRIEKVHMVGLGSRGDEKSALYDAKGHKHKVSSWSVRGDKYLDPHDITSPSEFVEGAKGFLIFEIPKNEKPVKLTFVYYFKESWEDKSAKRGQIDIKTLAFGYYGPNPGDIITNSIGMKLVYIPAGEFMMGSGLSASQVASQYDGKADLFTNEHPQHNVRISKGFWMGQTEVTQAQYRAVMGTNPSRFEGDNNPVEQVSWNDATEFCRKLSQKEGKTYTLPTEAQWEYACRGGTNTSFCFGDSDSNLFRYGNYCDRSNTSGYSWQDKQHDDGHDKTAPVGSYKPNGFGLYDMHGNVWEWCRDWYDSGYYNKNITTDPENTQSALNRVLRGGCWNYLAYDCRSANRDRGRSDPDYRSKLIGIRVVMEIEQVISDSYTKVEKPKTIDTGNKVIITGQLVKKDGSLVTYGRVEIDAIKGGEYIIKFGEDGVFLNPECEVDDEGRFTLELDLDLFEGAEAFAILARLKPFAQKSPLRNRNGSLIVFEFSEGAKNLDLGKIVVE